MFRSSTARVVLVVVAALALLTLLRYRPWQRAGGSHEVSPTASARGEPGEGRPKLTVGFLPVT